MLCCRGQYLSEANDVQLWLNEKNQLLAKEDYGRDAKAADKLLTKHKASRLYYFLRMFDCLI